MLRTRFFPLLGALLIGGCGLAGSASAQHQGPEDNLFDVVLPCGVRAALASIGDRSAPDRGHFVLEIARRLHHAPVGADVPRKDALTALVAHLDRCTDASNQAASDRAAGNQGAGEQAAAGRAASQPAAETVPLPLPVSTWVDAVFNGRVQPRRLVAAILDSRNASLLYIGLLSLDETTRNWIASRPDLVAEIATRHAAAFTLIAPGLRVTGAGLQVPGGQAAEPVWEALVGRSAKDPAEFIRALLIADERHLPYMFGTLSLLSPAQVQLALNLDARDPDARIASARRLHAVYVHVARGWRVDVRAFWRPTYDPALLAGDLRVDDEGRPQLLGTRRFWSAAFAQNKLDDDDPRELVEPDSENPFEFAWLCERVFDGDAPRHRSRYHKVLFASRVLRSLNAETVHAAVEAVRAAERYPALVAALERAGIVDVTTIAAAARRATQLSNIGDSTDAVRATAQFQGLLMLFQRAMLRESIDRDAFAGLVASLVAVDLAEGGGYGGRLVQWLATQLKQIPSDEDLESQPLERALLDLVAGPSSGAAPRIVEWEGTRYRVDFAAPEAARLERLRGEQPRPYVSAARVLIGIAGDLSNSKLSREALSRDAQAFARVADAVGWTGETGGDNWGDDHQWLGGVLDRARDVAATLERAGKRGDHASAARLAPAIQILADTLLARGVTHLVYVAALGRPERAGFSAEEAATHHDFAASINGVRNALGPWDHPVMSGAGQSRVIGSLLGLDVALAPFSLVRLSSRLPPMKPTLNENDRRALTESVVLAGAVGDADRDRIVDAIRNGRNVLAAAVTRDQAATIANQIGVIGTRRSLLIWTLTRAPDRAAAFLSPSELLWLGLGTARIDARLQAWGAPARARLGCLCLQLLDRRPLEPFNGRWGSGIFASAFPDLNLRLAELLAELRMPAALLGPVLTSATLELVNNTVSRDADDRRALVEFVQAISLDRLEQYLALLTTDGPLVPIGKARETADSAGVPR